LGIAFRPFRAFGLGMLIHRASPYVIGFNPFGASNWADAETIAMKGLNPIAMGAAHRTSKI